MGQGVYVPARSREEFAVSDRVEENDFPATAITADRRRTKKIMTQGRSSNILTHSKHASGGRRSLEKKYMSDPKEELDGDTIFLHIS
jgi:hypothetical protein